MDILGLLETRVIADSSDRVAWLKARSQGVTASDAARLATDKSVESVARSKWQGFGVSENPYLRHGREREPVLADWGNRNFGFKPSSSLYHSEFETQHLATPDGIGLSEDGTIILAEIKTTSKPWNTIPKNYLRQVWWQQYVLGSERTLLIWEEHRDFVPVREEPQCLWIERDDKEIDALVRRANRLLEIMYFAQNLSLEY